MISAVVLAAGSSSRMGRPKLLLPLGNEPIIRRVVRQIAAAGFEDILVVVGPDHEKILSALDGLTIRHTLNPDYETGMGSSFRAGVGALESSTAAMFMLADQPFVSSVEYQRMREAYQQQPSGIVCARYGEVTAPPHLFPREFFPELAQLEHGARPVLQRHRDRTTVVNLPADLLMDIDTPEDYERARVRIEGKERG